MTINNQHNEAVSVEDAGARNEGMVTLSSLLVCCFLLSYVLVGFPLLLLDSQSLLCCSRYGNLVVCLFVGWLFLLMLLLLSVVVLLSPIFWLFSLLVFPRYPATATTINYHST